MKKEVGEKEERKKGKRTISKVEKNYIQGKKKQKQNYIQDCLKTNDFLALTPRWQ